MLGWMRKPNVLVVKMCCSSNLIIEYQHKVALLLTEPWSCLSGISSMSGCKSRARWDSLVMMRGRKAWFHVATIFNCNNFGFGKDKGNECSGPR
jgi:hypothetical protein